jgi:hypothetical protein
MLPNRGKPDTAATSNSHTMTCFLIRHDNAKEMQGIRMPVKFRVA